MKSHLNPCAFEDELTAFVDGELPALRHKQVEAHLAGCSSCSGTVALIRSALSTLSRLPAFEPSSAMRRAVLRRIDEPASALERLAAFFKPLLMPALGMAAAALTVVVLAHRAQGDPPDAEAVFLAQNMEVLEDYEVLGLSPDDLDVVLHLHELEANP